jgi:succinoglycan biosynthesis transport protein ExoP
MDSGPLIPVNGQILREVQADLPIEMSRQVVSSTYHGLPVQDSVLREYLRVLIKRKWLVFSCLAIIFGVVALATMRSVRIYDATGSIAINKTDPTMLNIKESSNGGADYYDPTDLDTEVRILKSDLLALQVISQLNLDKRPEFGGTAASAPSTSLGLTTDSLQPDSEKTTALLAGFKAGLRVALVPNTRIIEIHYRSADKNLAANAVNTLITTYIEQNFKTRFESTRQASEWLSKQLVDLEMKVQTSQEKLVQYQKEHEILGIDEKQNIITSKLDELNKELTAAESDRMEKESVYRLVESGDPDTAAAAAVSAGAGGSSSTSLSSLMEKMREQQADLKIQIAQLSTQFGNSYPKVVQLNSQLKEVDAQLQAEMVKVVSRVRSGYLASLQHESMLREALEKQKQEANQLNESAIEYSLLKRDVESYRTLYEGLMEKLKEAGVTAGLKSNNIRNVDKARVPTEPSEPNVPRNLAFALGLGLTTGIGLAFLLEGIDNTVRTPEQAQAISALPSLGMIPLGSKTTDGTGRQRLIVASSRESVELVTQSRPQSQMAESYRALRTSLLLTSLGAPPKVILITSALPQEGKTTTSINTAIVLAQKGTRVLLIDADLRRPSIHKTLGMGPKTGLSNVLTGSATLQQAVVKSSIVPTLFILPAGTQPPNPAELLASSNMKDILAELREQYDHIIVDTPPTLSVTDAVVMSTRADAVVLVIRSGQTTKQALRRSRDLLMQVNAHIAGVLLNAVDLTSPDYYYYYEYQGKYGHAYYQEDELANADDTVPRAASSGT